MATHKTLFVTASLTDQESPEIHKQVHFRLHVYQEIPVEKLSRMSSREYIIVRVAEGKQWVLEAHQVVQFDCIYTRELLVGRLKDESTEGVVFIKEDAVYAAAMMGHHFDATLVRILGM